VPFIGVAKKDKFLSLFDFHDLFSFHGTCSCCSCLVARLSRRSRSRRSRSRRSRSRRSRSRCSRSCSRCYSCSSKRNLCIFNEGLILTFLIFILGITPTPILCITYLESELQTNKTPEYSIKLPCNITNFFNFLCCLFINWLLIILFILQISPKQLNNLNHYCVYKEVCYVLYQRVLVIGRIRSQRNQS
jgi:hypothetical protein